MTNLFITGTDTGVGKTHVTALLLAELRRRGHRAAAFKPIACGAGGRNDARRYRRLMHNEVPLDRLNPVFLRHPLAPSVAARLDHRRIDLRRIRADLRLLTSDFSPVLVEGAGGLLVPIKRHYFVADLVRDLGLPILIVARLGLGTINHTLLTVRQAQAAGLTVRGVVLNDTSGPPHGFAERTNLHELQRLLDVPIWGPVPYSGAVILSEAKDLTMVERQGRSIARSVASLRMTKTCGDVDNTIQFLAAHLFPPSP